MRRRDFFGLVGITVISPLMAAAQQRAKVFRIGYLGYSAPEQHAV
jgi:hypothetical protein